MANQLKTLESESIYHIVAKDVNDRVITAKDGHKFVDFCNTGYLGFDYLPELHQKGMEYSQKWGAISGWSRMEIDPEIYLNLEERIKSFINAKDVMLSHTITITNFSHMAAIAQKGVIFTDQVVHTVVWESCRLARDHGASIVRFNHQSIEDLERKIIANKDIYPKIIAVDGVYSISTEIAPIDELLRLCEKYDCFLYVDDAHGFGVLGENPTKKNPLGLQGNGIVKHFDRGYDRTFYVSSFGKAFGTSTAFTTIPDKFEGSLRAVSTQFLFSAPPSPYTIGTVEAALDLNELIGDLNREKILELVQYFCRELENEGIAFDNRLGQPVVYIPVGELDDFMWFARKLFKLGFLPGHRAYPLVPKDACGMRFAITALHTIEQMASLVFTLKTLFNELREKQGISDHVSKFSQSA